MNRSSVLALVVALLTALAAAQSPSSRPASRDFTRETDGTTTLRGRVVLVGHDGKLRGRGQGHGSLVAWQSSGRGETGSFHPIEIIDGEWSLSLGATETPDRVSLRDCVIDDTLTVTEPDGIAITDDAVLTFHALARRAVRLSVVDAAARTHLPGVEVFRWAGAWPRVGIHPGRSHRLLADMPGVILEPELIRVVGGERSPIEVPPESVRRATDDHVYWVRAPGYAWQAVRVRATEGGDREVALVRGGGLRVQLRGALPRPPARVTLRLCRPDQGEPRQEAEFAVTTDPFELIEALPVGPWELRLELGDRDQPLVLARAQAEVEPGKATSVELQIDAGAVAPARTVIRGTVAIPSAWLRGEGPSLSLEPLDETRSWVEGRYLSGDDLRRGERPGEYLFTLHEMPAGRYALSVSPSQHRHVFTVAAPEASLRIDVPAPLQVVWRVVDGTGAPRSGASLHWHPPRPAGVTRGSTESAQAAADSNVVRALVAAGRVVVSGSGEDFDVAEQTLDVGPGKTEFQLLAKPVFGVKVELYEGDRRLRTGFGSGWRVTLDAIDGPNDWLGWRGEATVVPMPGRYWLRIQGPEVYEQVPDRQVALHDGPLLSIQIKVKRKP